MKIKIFKRQVNFNKQQQQTNDKDEDEEKSVRSMFFSLFLSTQVK